MIACWTFLTKGFLILLPASWFSQLQVIIQCLMWSFFFWSFICSFGGKFEWNCLSSEELNKSNKVGKPTRSALLCIWITAYFVETPTLNLFESWSLILQVYSLLHLRMYSLNVIEDQMKTAKIFLTQNLTSVQNPVLGAKHQSFAYENT